MNTDRETRSIPFLSVFICVHLWLFKGRQKQQVRFFGKGFFNGSSGIPLSLLSSREEPIHVFSKRSNNR